MSRAGRPVLPIQPEVPSNAVNLSPLGLCEMLMRLFGALVNNSIGASPPPANTVPFITRLVIFLMAPSPPRAMTYLSRMSAAVGAALGCAAVLASAWGDTSHVRTGGMFAGLDAAWCHDKRVI